MFGNVSMSIGSFPSHMFFLTASSSPPEIVLQYTAEGDEEVSGGVSVWMIYLPDAAPVSDTPLREAVSRRRSNIVSPCSETLSESAESFFSCLRLFFSTVAVGFFRIAV